MGLTADRYNQTTKTGSYGGTYRSYRCICAIEFYIYNTGKPCDSIG